MNVGLFHSRSRPRKSTLRVLDRTLRNFSGGLNVVSSEINLRTKFAPVLVNWFHKSDGSQSLRFGSKWFATWDVIINGTKTINSIYFNGSIVFVTDHGEVGRMTDAGVVTVIFNATIAAALPGSPNAWTSPITQCDFTAFKTSLAIHNGIDKPLEVKSTFAVVYLADAATGSNINTPVGKYGTTVGNYHVIAGISALTVSTIAVSSTGTIGTFPSDPAPNDSITIDVGAYISQGDNTIRGLSSFRNILLVHFQETTLPINLGVFNSSGTHTPDIQDAVPKFGLLSHRAIEPLVNDILFGDAIGLNTMKRNVFATTVESDRFSQPVEPLYRQLVVQSTPAEMQTDIFGVYDRLAGKYMLFIPNTNNTQTILAFRFDEKFRRRSWSLFSYKTVIIDSAVSTALGRVFIFVGKRIIQYGNDAYPDENYTADFIGDWTSIWANSVTYAVGEKLRDDVTNETYVCLVAHTSASSGAFAADRTTNPTLWKIDDGDEIEFEWELPWFDINGRRAVLKRLGFLALDTQGLATFNVSIFVDNIYKITDKFRFLLEGDMADDAEDFLLLEGDEVTDAPDFFLLEGETGNFDPALTLQYVGGDSPGFGNLDQPFGAGRRTKDERLWSNPVKGNIFKVRFHGSTKLGLSINAITFLYATGKHGR